MIETFDKLVTMTHDLESGADDPIHTMSFYIIYTNNFKHLYFDITNTSNHIN